MEQNKKSFRMGCIVCGKPLEYFDSAKVLKCEMCGNGFEAHCACQDGHYICDSCHTQRAFDFIADYALETVEKNPIAIASQMMSSDLINMHGPEHHYLIVAALLAAYKNCGGDIELDLSLKKALQRARNVPGGICGLWGSCGAGIASGIFISIITGATSLSQREWSLSNAMTSMSLSNIAKNGGPRCCKRNTYLAIKAAIEFVHKHLDIEMDQSDDIECAFFHMNKQCRKYACPFWPKQRNYRL